MLALVLSSGCYLSHEPSGVARDGGVTEPPRVDAAMAGACTFSWRDVSTGALGECRIEPGSASGCLDAARCICAAGGASGEELEQCVEWSVVPRGAITFADYCTEGPPARMTMAEALEGYLSFEHGGALGISPECGGIPALLGD